MENVKYYDNADISKLNIITDNNNKSGIYLWTHRESNKSYVGSTVNLSRRFKYYYFKNILNRASNKNSYIYRVLLEHKYSAFS